MTEHRRRPGDLEIGRILGSDQPCVLSHADRRKHLYVCGSTGVGKSKFLESLIRQDIVDWPDTGEGLLLIDPHGAIYNSLMTWLAEEKIDYPVIPIDLSRDDWIVGYNWLRKRNASASVVIGNLLAAIAHVWGQSGTDFTPQFEQWCTGTLSVLYEKGYTLAEATHLTKRRAMAVRRYLTDGLADQLAADDWEYANALSPKDFNSETGSTIRRVARFMRCDVIRASLGQREASLDLGQALGEGHIILVSLARQRGTIQKEDADLFGTLLLSDLWSAAQERRKPDDERDVKRFNVYVDEFSRFVTPTMAEQLAEARGFGISMTMAQQFPRQLISQGENGQRLFEEVMENASTKVVFRMQNPENIEPLAKQLFMGTFNTDDRKLELYATKVLAYRQETRRSHTTGESEGFATASGRAHGAGHAHGESSLSSSSSGMDPTGDLRAWNETFGEAAGQNDTDSRFESESDSESTSSMTSRSETTQVVDVPILGKELSSVQYRSIEEQLFQSMQKLFRQQDRQCAARMVGQNSPVFLRTDDVRPAVAKPEEIERYRQMQMSRWPFFLPMAEAMKRISERDTALVRAALTSVAPNEPVTARRRVT